jgi:hypothetical protein
MNLLRNRTLLKCINVFIILVYLSTVLYKLSSVSTTNQLFDSPHYSDTEALPGAEISEYVPHDLSSFAASSSSPQRLELQSPDTNVGTTGSYDH